MLRYAAIFMISLVTLSSAFTLPDPVIDTYCASQNQGEQALVFLVLPLSTQTGTNSMLYFRTASAYCYLSTLIGSVSNAGGNVSFGSGSGTCTDGSSVTIQTLSYVPATLTFSITFLVGGQFTGGFTWEFPQVTPSRCLLTQLPSSTMCGQTDDGQYAAAISALPLQSQTNNMPVQAAIATASPFASMQYNGTFGYIIIDGNLVFFPMSANSLYSGSLSIISSSFDGTAVNLKAVINGKYYVSGLSSSQCGAIAPAYLCGTSADSTSIVSASFSSTGYFAYNVQSLDGSGSSCSNYAVQAVLVGTTVVLPQGYGGSGWITQLQYISGSLTLTTVCDGESVVATVSATQCGTIPAATYCGSSAALGVMVGMTVQSASSQSQTISGLISFGSHTSTSACSFSGTVSPSVNGIIFFYESTPSCSGVELQNATLYNGQLVVYGSLYDNSSFAAPLSTCSSLQSSPYCGVTADTPAKHAVVKQYTPQIAVFADIGGTTLQSNCAVSSSSAFVFPSSSGGVILSSFSGYCNSTFGGNLVTNFVLTANGAIQLTFNNVAFTLNTGNCIDPLTISQSSFCGSSTMYSGQLSMSSIVSPAPGWSFSISANTPSLPKLSASCSITSGIFMIVSGTVVTTSLQYSNCFQTAVTSITYSASTGFTVTDDAGNTLTMTTDNCNALPTGGFCSSSGPVQGGIRIPLSLTTSMEFYLSGSGTVGTQFALCSNTGYNMINIGGKLFFQSITSDSCTSSISSIAFNANANALTVTTAGGTSTFTSSLAGACGALPNGQYCGSGSEHNLIVNVSGYQMNIYLAPLQSSALSCTGSSMVTILAGNLVFSTGFQLSCVGTVQSMTFSAAAFAMQIGSESFTSVSAGSCQSLPSQPVCGADSKSNAVKLYWPGALFGSGFGILCNVTNFIPIGAVGGYIMYYPSTVFSCYPYVFTINSLLGGGTQSVTLNFQVQEATSGSSYNSTITMSADMCGTIAGGSYCIDGNNRGSATVTPYGSNTQSMVLILAPHDHKTQTSCVVNPNNFVVIGNNVLTSYPLQCSYGRVNLTYSATSSTLTAMYLPSNVVNPSPSSFPMTLGSCLVIPAATYCGSAGSGNVVVMAVNGSIFTLLVSSEGSVLGPFYGQLAVASQGDIIMSFFSFNDDFNVTAATFNGGQITLSLSSGNFAFGSVQLWIGACGAIPAGQYCGSTLSLSASAVVSGLMVNISVMTGNGGASQICYSMYVAVDVGGTFLSMPNGGTCGSAGTISSVSWLSSSKSLVLQTSTKPNLVLQQSLCGAVPSGFYCGRAPYPISDTEATIQVTGAGVMNLWVYTSGRIRYLTWPSSLLWQHSVVIDYRDQNGNNVIKSLTFSDGALTLGASFSWASFNDLVLQSGSCNFLSVASPSSTLGFTQTALSVSSSTISLTSPFCSVSASFVAAVSLQNGLVQLLGTPSTTPPSSCILQGVYGKMNFMYNERSTGSLVVSTFVLNFPGTWVLGSGSATGGNGAPPSGQGNGAAAGSNGGGGGATVAIGFTALGALVIVCLAFVAWKKFAPTFTSSADAPQSSKYAGPDVEEPMIQAEQPVPQREVESNAA